ncbi:MAG: RluA family pseudouridine synthase [Bryobacterales bacterium]|nr:RluA family pseudouridine synthase [Bryobacteraceae bacterium]MDW8129602.1 RluA family pseudouridine synthase [Bryobacterales bacterium]
MQQDSSSILIQAPSSSAGTRLDRFLQERLPEFSRTRIQQWIRAGRVRVGGAPAEASHRLRGGEWIEVEPAAPPPLRAEPEPIPLQILYEDEHVIAVDKPAGMVVHAGAGRRSGTLVNALLARYGSLSQAGGELRPGIVHRLDRLTSGVLLVARTDLAHQRLAAQFAARQIEKIYLALVHRQVREDHGFVQAPIGRDPRRRTRMRAGVRQGREAATEFRVLRRFPGFTYLEVRPRTGRTHQIRTHLASIGHPVVGDPAYGAPRVVEDMPPLERYFLHAHCIGFRHPATGEWLRIESPLPAELQVWLDALEQRAVTR